MLRALASHIAPAAASAELPPAIRRLQDHVTSAAQFPAKGSRALTLRERVAASPIGGGSPDPPDDDAASAVENFATSLEQLGLAPYVEQLDVQGYTIIPPDVVGLPSGLLQALRAAVFRVADERAALDPDVAAAREDGMQRLYQVLYEDEVFERALLLPPMRAMIDYLLGADCLLSSSIATIKRRGDQPFPLHADGPSNSRDAPLGATAMLLLSDYDGERSGSTAFVPFSHRVGHGPWRPEHGDFESAGAVAARGAAGSLMVWSEKTWHGAYPRAEPTGERVDLLFFHCLSCMLTEEDYRGTVTDAALARNPPQFATLMAQRVYGGWDKEGPAAQLARNRERLERLGLA